MTGTMARAAPSGCRFARRIRIGASRFAGALRDAVPEPRRPGKVMVCRAGTVQDWNRNGRDVGACAGEASSSSSSSSSFPATLAAAMLAVALNAAPPDASAAVTDASYVGVGLEIFVAPDKLPTVIEFLGPEGKKDGPARDAGMQVNDKLLEIGGTSTSEMGGLQGVAAALRGEGNQAPREKGEPDEVEVLVARKEKGSRGATTKRIVIARGTVAPNPRSCFVASCARV